jgi:Holliday junction resolvase-like predicted endonuclease
MTTFDAGRRAESLAADYLRRKGCAIVAQNWRTRFCEIDVIAQRSNVVYFCEVKYRRTNNQGGGLDYILPKKLQQMRFAAEAWVHLNKWQGEYQLCAIEVSGEDFKITAVIKDL